MKLRLYIRNVGTDNKHLQKTINPNFTDKILKDEEIFLVEGDKVVTTEIDFAETFKYRFKNIVESLHNRPL